MRPQDAVPQSSPWLCFLLGPFFSWWKDLRNQCAWTTTLFWRVLHGRTTESAHQVAYPVIFPSPAGKTQEWFHYLLPWLFNNYLLQVGLWLARGKSWIFSNLSHTKVLILRRCGQWMNRKTSGVRMASAQTLGRSVERRMLPGLIGKRPNKAFQKGPLYLALFWVGFIRIKKSPSYSTDFEKYGNNISHSCQQQRDTFHDCTNTELTWILLPIRRDYVLQWVWL